MAKYTHTKGGTTIKVDMPSFAQVTKNLGIDEKGKVQTFATKRAAMRMDKYVPMRTGILIQTKVVRQTEIEYVQVYARPMYFGIDPRTGKRYTYGGAPQRGSFWDEKMIKVEGEQWVDEVQEFSNKQKTK